MVSQNSSVTVYENEVEEDDNAFARYVFFSFDIADLSEVRCSKAYFINLAVVNLRILTPSNLFGCLEFVFFEVTKPYKRCMR